LNATFAMAVLDLVYMCQNTTVVKRYFKLTC